MQCKHASQIEKPREGTGLSGPYRVNESGNYAKAGITTPCVNKGDNSRILVQCDIGATEAGTEADLIPLCEQGWQLRDVARYAASFILGKHLRYVSVIRVLACIPERTNLSVKKARSSDTQPSPWHL
jgi:hypothetical protein